MRALLAWSSLRRHPLRTALAILGVAVSAAMLLDMVMLSSGMQVSFRALLTRQGFDVRVTPKGTLPFDAEARIAGGAAAESVIRQLPGVRDVSPVLGTTLHLVRGEDADAVFALGVRPEAQGDYSVERGGDADAPDRMVANPAALGQDRTCHRRQRRRRGWATTRSCADGPRAGASSSRARRAFTTSPTDQPAVALPLATAQSLVAEGDASSSDQVSLLMIRPNVGVDAEALRTTIERALPRVTAIATADAVKSVEQRLGYFRQLALILGTVSLAVGFLLVSTLVTVSVQERVGEMAIMRAIGVSRPHIAVQVMLEGLVISVVGAVAGLVLGLATARYLNTILRSFPGLPAAIDFFVFEPVAAYQSFALLIATAVLAGAFPAWRAGSLPIATTLRTEAVS